MPDRGHESRRRPPRRLARFGHDPSATRPRGGVGESAARRQLTGSPSNRSKPRRVRSSDRADLSATLLQALVLSRELANLQKDDDAALAELNDAVAKRPNEAEPLLLRGRFCANRAQWDKAALDFTKVVDTWPKDRGSWFEAGRFYSQRGQRELAVADFTKATALRPNDVDLRLESGSRSSCGAGLERGCRRIPPGGGTAA